MKRVIDGKVYDTETAKKIASWGHKSNDFDACTEILYKTKKGAWFLVGDGCARTFWTRPGNNITWGTSGVRVMTTKDALEWCQYRDIDTDTIKKHAIDNHLKIEEA